MFMKIYTKTGDKGTTRLVDGACVEKFSPRVEAYGTVDELNSQIGVLSSELEHLKSDMSMKSEVTAELFRIQHWLFNAGSLIATGDLGVRTKLPQIENSHIEFLELAIDRMTSQLPELRNFILPGGHMASSIAHVCRTICRRAERRTAEVMISDAELSQTLIFLNRLSDYFFTLARYLNLKSNVPEVIWKKESSV